MKCEIAGSVKPSDKAFVCHISGSRCIFNQSNIYSIFERRCFTLTLNPTAKKLSGHISGQVQVPNLSPLLTVSRDLYSLLLKATPARCKKFFCSSQNPADSTASTATTASRLVILTAVSQCFNLKGQLTSERGLGLKALIASLLILKYTTCSRMNHLQRNITEWCGNKQLVLEQEKISILVTFGEMKALFFGFQTTHLLLHRMHGTETL